VKKIACQLTDEQCKRMNRLEDEILQTINDIVSSAAAEQGLTIAAYKSMFAELMLFLIGRLSARTYVTLNEAVERLAERLGL